MADDAPELNTQVGGREAADPLHIFHGDLLGILLLQILLEGKNATGRLSRKRFLGFYRLKLAKQIAQNRPEQEMSCFIILSHQLEEVLKNRPDRLHLTDAEYSGEVTGNTQRRRFHQFLIKRFVLPRLKRGLAIDSIGQPIEVDAVTMHDGRIANHRLMPKVGWNDHHHSRFYSHFAILED